MSCSFRWGVLPLVLVVVTLVPAHAIAKEWFVGPGGSGDGSNASPFGSIQAALDVALAGDVVTVRPGTYAEHMVTVRNGTPSAPITVRATFGRGSVLVTVPGEVLQIDHGYIVVDGLVLDAQYAAARIVDVNTPATSFVLRNAEVRRASRDCVDLDNPQGVVIDNVLIHHCLNAANGRTDAHGIAAGAVKNFTIRNTEIHTFSGDAVQLDPDRLSPGWDGVTIEGSRFWLAPLPEDANGFPAGTVPGENAVDTKTLATAPRARLTIRDTIASGFRGGLITNMAAFNLKENIDALLDGVTVFDSEIAFRTRGPGVNGGAWVRIQNAVVYDVDKAVRYEDEIERLKVFNTTIGLGVARAFQAASSGRAGLDVRNVLLLGTEWPVEALDPSNRAVDSTTFLDAPGADYHLNQGTVPIDTGDAIEGVIRDRDGVVRPQGAAYDVGAYEFEPPTEENIAPTVTVTATDPTATEAGVTTGTFAVSRTGSTAAALTVNYTVSGAATPGSDYTALTGSVTIPAAAVSATIIVTPTNDTAVEQQETVLVSLRPHGAYIVGAPNSATVTIASDDVSPPSSISLRSPTANAADSGGDGNGFEVSPSNAHTDDTLHAVDNNSGTGSSTSCTGSSKDKHRFYNYGLTFPTGVSIRGIEVRLDARVNGTSGSPKMCVQVSWNGGTTWTSPKSTTTLGTSMGTFTLGGPTDTWGRSWTTGNFADANFRVRVINVSSSPSRAFALDWVAVRVHYE